MEGCKKEISRVRVKALTGNIYLGDLIKESLRRQADIFILDGGSVLVYWKECGIGNPKT